METTKTITTIKLTGETVLAAKGVSAAARLRGCVVLAAGVPALGGTGLSGTGMYGTGLSGAGMPAATGLTRGWTPVVVERSERPVQAPKAVAAADLYGHVHTLGADNQQDYRIHQAAADFAADAARSAKAFRGRAPWRERT
ncbi:hypothetical protein LO771_10540 [Streptacidiphilus sp. ASG 303]|uniref:hypothetical protein n=1 Tax=Streptacidiphilus sp. ASG 303 TaxID=2896847 RepID=UPI001E451339|nr:hypothetical protein [Streptacidiphilus sp. ASG 303]MCD0482825.1 hypothetical protein [Streptacidiphilus sp. ASG 303]